jgi:hypothetical protein
MESTCKSLHRPDRGSTSSSNLRGTRAMMKMTGVVIGLTLALEATSALGRQLRAKSPCHSLRWHGRSTSVSGPAGPGGRRVRVGPQAVTLLVSYFFDGFISSVGGKTVEPASASGVNERLLGASLAHMRRTRVHRTDSGRFAARHGQNGRAVDAASHRQGFFTQPGPQAAVILMLNLQGRGGTMSSARKRLTSAELICGRRALRLPIGDVETRSIRT